jgi:hypothetical protein
MSDPGCRNFRELLGVYVVGAIEPNERATLEAHLSYCYDCREELAGLAVLPALLHRIPLGEAEQIAEAGLSGAEQEDPAPQVLAGLLTEVKARRQSKLVRTMLAAAAAVVIAVGGSVAVTNALGQHQQHQVAFEVVRARLGGISGEIKYEKSAQWGTEIFTRVHGVPQGTYCQLWLTSANKHTQLVGGWLVMGPGGNEEWYPSTTKVPKSNITAFTLTAAGKVLLRFPVT